VASKAGIFLHSHQDSFLYFHFSRIHHPLFLSFIPTVGPTFPSPSWLLPPPHRIPSHLPTTHALRRLRRHSPTPSLPRCRVELPCFPPSCAVSTSPARTRSPSSSAPSAAGPPHPRRRASSLAAVEVLPHSLSHPAAPPHPRRRLLSDGSAEPLQAVAQITRAGLLPHSRCMTFVILPDLRMYESL
jgi:hypothetical protein